MVESVRWFTEEDVLALAPLERVIDAVQRALQHQAEGTAWTLDKAVTTWPAPQASTASTAGQRSSSAHALGAVDIADDLVAFKTWVNTPAGATAAVTAFSAADGRLRAVLEATTLGALRTAAMSGLATRWMADPGADELAVIGSGRQAMRQVAAIAAVRSLRSVRVWSRTPKHATHLTERIRAELELPARAHPRLDTVLDGAGIVTSVTRATEPFLCLDQLAEGAHLNAVGAVLPGNAEFRPNGLGLSALTVVDDLANARQNSRELGEFHGDDWSAVSTMADLVGGKIVRPARPRCTVFKSLGTGLADLAVVALVLASSAAGHIPPERYST